MSIGVLREMLWHAKRIFRTTSNSASRTISPRESMAGVERKTTSPPGAKQSAVCSGRHWPSDAELIGRALQQSGLSDARQEDLEFYEAAARDGALNGRDARKRGRALTKQEKADLGISYRGILSAEFIETLNANGIADPEGAAWQICSHAGQLLRSRDQIMEASDRGISLLRFRASPMAAGPCPKAAAQNEGRIPIGAAQITPFEQCTHPDQCACMWQSWLPLLGELDG